MHEEVTITRRGAERVRVGGHLWVYRSDVQRGASGGGQVVRVRDQGGRFVGMALYSDRSEIALRILTLQNEAVDREWWRRRLRHSIERRAHLALDSSAYRLVFSEGDLLPSLIVDRYADVLVVQTLSQGAEALKPVLVELLVEELQPEAIIERNDVRVRELEGLKLQAGVLYGEAPEEFEVNQHGIRFLVDPLRGQKTGTFLDQRENHQVAGRLAHGRRALDCFTFNGAFALNLAKRCEQVIGLDISGEAVAAAEHNARINALPNASFREANVFDALREMETAGERFSTIVLDPPAFAKSRASSQAAARGYKEINLRALKLLETGGVLITCTCSYHVSEEMFLDIVTSAASDAHRRLQVIEKRIQAADHPVLVGVPETLYLKCLILRVIE